MTNPPGPADWREPLKRRIVWMAGCLALWVAGIETRLVYLQVFARADLVARAERQQERTQPSPAKRGDILDRRGRVLATSVMMVCVAVVADLMGIFGGLFTSKFFLGIGYTQYIQHTFDAVKVRDFVTGLIKAGCFGTLISGIACYLGLGVTGGAQGVGVATTRTVVLTIVAILIRKR